MILLLPPKGNLLMKHVTRECLSQNLCPELLSCNVCQQSWRRERSLAVSGKATRISKALLVILLRFPWLTRTETELGSLNRQPCRPAWRAGEREEQLVAAWELAQQSAECARESRSRSRFPSPGMCDSFLPCESRVSEWDTFNSLTTF